MARLLTKTGVGLRAGGSFNAIANVLLRDTVE